VGVATAFPYQESFFFATFPERFASRPRQTTKPFRKDLKNAASVKVRVRIKIKDRVNVRNNVRDR